jgi:hypothetical protein
VHPRKGGAKSLVAGALLAIVVTCVPAAVSSATATSATATPASARSSAFETTASTGSLSLVAPPSVATPTSPFEARLLLPSGSNRPSLSLDLSLYGCLGSRSAFDQTLGATPSGQRTQSQSIPVSSLPADKQNPAAVDLTVAVSAGGAAPVGNGALTADLRCSPSYYGVYPLRIQLVENASSTPIGQLTTYLVFTAPAAQPLHFALVFPLSLPVSVPTSSGTPLPTSSDISRLESLAAALASSPAPATVVPLASTLSSLASARAVGSKPASTALGLLTELASPSQSASHQVLCGPFSAVDASELVSQGLSNELTYQVQEGEAATSAVLHTSCAQNDTWIAQGTVDQAAIGALSALGFSRVVVPESSLAGTGPANTVQTLFALGNPHATSLLSAVADPGLASRLQSASRSDAALAAHQLVAELDQIYFDAPNSSGRGVVAVAPASISSDPAFVSDVLSALQSDPIVRAVTLRDFLGGVVGTGGYVGGVDQPATRRPASGSVSSSLPAHAIRDMRSRVQSFTAAASRSVTGQAVVQQLNQLLLASESSDLSASQQQIGVSRTSDALDAQLSSLSVNTGDVRLASTAALVPITLVKNLPYPVTGVLQVTSDKLVFPSAGQAPGSQCGPAVVGSSAGRSTFSSVCQISHSTNVVYVDMRSRATGDFRVSVTLRSPSGNLVLVGAQLSVRSMSISAVSIALSVAAAVVLAGWWGGTAWRRRTGRRTRPPAHARSPSRTR